MRMRGRGLSGGGGLVTTNTRQAASLQGGHLRAPPDGASAPPGGKLGGAAPSENVARGAVPGRLPGLAARRKGVLEPAPLVPLSKTGVPMTVTNVPSGRGVIKTSAPRIKHLPAPWKLPVRTNNSSTAPIAAPETASSAPTTPWQLPNTTSLNDQLPKFPYNTELPNKLPKLLKTQQQPTRPDSLQNLVSCTSSRQEQIQREPTTENQTVTTLRSLLDPSLKDTSMASSMAPSPQSDTADLSSLKGIIQVLAVDLLLVVLVIDDGKTADDNVDQIPFPNMPYRVEYFTLEAHN